MKDHTTGDNHGHTDLNENKTDWTVFTLKTGASLVPFVGGALAEIIGQLIPGQRIDRIQKYIELLDESIKRLPEDIVKELLKNELFISLVEDSFYLASRALTDERRRYIVEILERGMTSDDAKINDSKYLLSLLSELNDNEIIWLRYFRERTMQQKQKFMQKHGNVLQKEIVTLGSDTKVRRKAAVQDSYAEHLERLGLIKHHLDMQKVVPESAGRAGLTSKDVNVPNYDNFGKLKVSYSETTTLGNMLLEHIGLVGKDGDDS